MRLAEFDLGVKGDANHLVGIDEVGLGALARPIVAAAGVATRTT